MNNKKKSLILIIFLIVSIQIFLLINNRQKTSFRYFIWNIEEVSIGRLICISFVSGLLVNSILIKTLQMNVGTHPENRENDKGKAENEDTINIDDNNESNEMPPERDLRDTQPTISVNYRVIKDNKENELNGIKQRSQNTKYEDDWDNNDSEW